MRRILTASAVALAMAGASIPAAAFAQTTVADSRTANGNTMFQGDKAD